MNDILNQMFDERKLGGMGLAALLPGVRFIREMAQKYEAAMVAELNARHEAETVGQKRRGRPRKIQIPGLTAAEQRVADTVESATKRWTAAEIAEKAGIGTARVYQIVQEKKLKVTKEGNRHFLSNADAQRIFNRKTNPVNKNANHPRNPGHPDHEKFIKRLVAARHKAQKAAKAESKATVAA